MEEAISNVKILTLGWDAVSVAAFSFINVVRSLSLSTIPTSGFHDNTSQSFHDINLPWHGQVEIGWRRSAEGWDVLYKCGSDDAGVGTRGTPLPPPPLVVFPCKVSPRRRVCGRRWGNSGKSRYCTCSSTERYWYLGYIDLWALMGQSWGKYRGLDERQDPTGKSPDVSQRKNGQKIEEAEKFKRKVW